MIHNHISVLPDSSSSSNALLTCLPDITDIIWLKKEWAENEIKLVTSKAERQRRQPKFPSLSKQIKTHFTDLGVILDSDLYFICHFNKVAKTYFFHLRNVATIMTFLTQSDEMHTFMTSQLDDCNTLFTGLPESL